MFTTYITKYQTYAIFCSQSSSGYHLFGITESRLDFKITDHSISIPDNHNTRRDPHCRGRLDLLCMHVHQSVQVITHRRKDLENDSFECVWLELKPHAHGPSHTPSNAFRHLPLNSARFSYATEGVLFISA